MTSTYKLFENFSSSARKGLFALIALAIPVEFINRHNDLDWSRKILAQISADIDLHEEYYEAFVPMVESTHTSDPSKIQHRKDMCFALTSALDFQERKDVRALIELLIFLTLNRYYDGRGRTLYWNFARMIGVAKSDALSIEVSLKESIKEFEEAIQLNAKKEEKTARYKRYAKVGAVALGAGALLAITGGLAAPAIAGALAAFGYTTAASMATAGLLATVCGSTGAGLAGYKMLNRTKGLEEFQIDHVGDKGHLAVMIMVTGFLEKKEDMDCAFGILTDDVDFEEALGRFYRIYDPIREPNARKDALFWKDDQLEYIEKLRQDYQHDPISKEDLTPLYELKSPLPEADLKFMSDTLAKVLVQKQEQITSADGKTEEVKRNSTSEETAKNPSEGKHYFCSEIEMSQLKLLAEVCGEQSDGMVKAREKLRHQKEIEPEIANDFLKTTDNEDDDCIIEEIKPEVTLKINIESENSSENAALTVDRSALQKLDYIQYWHWNEMDIAPLYERYLVRWETKIQLKLADDINTFLEQLASQSMQSVFLDVLLPAVAAAITYPKLVYNTISDIDGVWNMAMVRADLAGKELAEALLARKDKRAVTLVGYSMGALVIYSCLKQLATHKYGPEPTLLSKAKKAIPLYKFTFGAQKINDDVTDQELKVDILQDCDETGTGGAVAHRAAELLRVDNEKSIPSSRSGEPNSLDEIGDDSMRLNRVNRKAMEQYDLQSYQLDFLYNDDDLHSEDETVDDNDCNKENPKNKSETEEPKPAKTGWMGKMVNKFRSKPTTELKESTQSNEKTGFENVNEDIGFMIQDVVLLGTPVSAKSPTWNHIRKIVNGRLINGFSTKDNVLKIIFRYKSATLSVAGISEVKAPGIENVNLSDEISQHLFYRTKIKDILEKIDLTGYSKDISNITEL